MTLTLIDPSTSPVVVHPGGIISVRCADYPGAARGTLSTVSDSLAASGTAVKEEQELAVATSTTGVSVFARWPSAGDTVVIPLGDLGRAPRTRYLPWVSIRVEGDVPSSAVANSDWLMFDIQNSLNVGVAMGIGSTMSASLEELPGERIPHYTLYDFRNSFVSEAETDAEEFVIRAWGVVGGDMAIYLETVYFVPLLDASLSYGETRKHANEQLFPSSHVMDHFSNGVLWRDIDNDPADLPDGFGKFSTMLWGPPWSPGSRSWGQIVEFQEADNEESAGDVFAFGNLGDPAFFNDPVRGTLAIPVGATYIPAAVLLYDDFTVEQHVHATYGAHYTAKVGDYTRTLGLGGSSHVTDWWDAPSPTGSRRGTFVETGDGFATTYFGPSSGSNAPGTGHELPGGTKGFYGDIMYGALNREGGFAASESGSDPRNLERFMYDHLEAFISSCRVSIDAVGNGGVFVGLHWDNLSAMVAGGHLRVDAAGDVSLSLATRRGSTINPPGWHDFAAPVTVGSGYTPGDWWWVKVEKRGYWWRARAWLDGTAEPSTWDVEAGQPLLKTAASPSEFIDYPWDDNWVGDVSNDTEAFDPRGGPGGPADISGVPYSLIYWESGQSRARIFTDDYTIEVDPGGTSPGDIHMKIEKYDGTVDIGTVTIPYGAHRFVETSLEALIFNADQNGFNVRLWKEPGSPDLMTAGLGRLFFRIPLRSWFPFVYRRVHGG